jgi:hypothetical protein
LKIALTEILKSEKPKSEKIFDFDFNIDDESDLSDMEKIPDIVKSLREFSGDPSEYGSWKKSVERILVIYNSLKNSTKYYAILNVIRNKIVGNADIALESYNTPLNWEKISKCLNLHYADKRDLGTLEYQMTTLIQRNDMNVNAFYQAVYQHLSLILNKLSSMDMSQESLNVMTQAYRDKALDTFVRGLKGDLPRLLSVKEPEDLPQALHLCLKLQNVDYRIQHSHNVQQNRYFHAPPVPPKKMMNFPVPPAPRMNFYPQLLHNPQIIQKPRFANPIPPRPYNQQFGQNFNHNFQNGQNFNPNFQNGQNFNPNFQYGQNSYPNFNPFPPPRQQHGQNFNPNFQHGQNYNPNFKKPEPMEVDQSLRSRAVNYQNRPQMNQFGNKRLPSQQIPQPNKFQRIFFNEQSPEKFDQYQENFDDQSYENSEGNQAQLENEYIDTEIDPSTEEAPDTIHFLD